MRSSGKLCRLLFGRGSLNLSAGSIGVMGSMGESKELEYLRVVKTPSEDVSGAGLNSTVGELLSREISVHAWRDNARPSATRLVMRTGGMAYVGRND